MRAIFLVTAQASPALISVTGALLSQGDAGAGNAIAGSAGWVGAGLLGLVLSWLLLVRLPATDRQTQNLIESRDKMCKDMDANHDSAFALAEKERRSDFQAALKTITDHCDREMATYRDFMQKDLGEVSSAIVDLRRTMEELRELYMRQPPRQ